MLFMTMSKEENRKKNNIYVLESSGYASSNGKVFSKIIKYGPIEKFKVDDVVVSFDFSNYVSNIKFFGASAINDFPILSDKDVKNIEESLVLLSILDKLLYTFCNGNFLRQYLIYSEHEARKSIVWKKLTIRKKMSKVGSVDFIRSFSILEPNKASLFKLRYCKTKDINLENVCKIAEYIEEIGSVAK